MKLDKQTQKFTEQNKFLEKRIFFLPPNLLKDENPFQGELEIKQQLKVTLGTDCWVTI